VPSAARGDGAGDRIGMLLTDDTDWEEIRELVTESSRSHAGEYQVRRSGNSAG
jgi:hypothetical protein